MNRFTDLHVAVYVTGSVACYKALSLIRLLKKKRADVRVIMSEGARQFISPLMFKAISGSSVLCNRNWKSFSRIPHVDLANWSNIAIVIPATSNVIAKMANGVADGIVSTCLLATNVPKFVVPAMNDRMWNNPATRRNVKAIDSYSDVHRLGPVFGQLAEDYSGSGRMLEPDQILNRINKGLNRFQPLSRTKIVVTAGSTREPIDPVRFITNPSTGKMGIAIAKKARQMGADVTLICGHTDVPVPRGIKVVRALTTEDMLKAVLKSFSQARVLIMSAALADFKPVKPTNQKIKKTSGKSSKGLRIRLEPTPDVLRNVAKIKKRNQLTVGFAAETQHLQQNAAQKLRNKKLDLIVANDVGNSAIGFGSDNNQVTFIDSKGRRKQTVVESKSAVAEQLLRIVAKLKDDQS